MQFWKRCGSVISRALLLLVVSVASVGAYVGLLELTGNFHSVIDGELYRSAQLSGRQISEYKNLLGIKTIINLRGENTGSQWYDEEIEAAKKAGIEHMDFRMSAKRELTQEQAQSLISLLKTAPKPILIHCRQGADRTGLASALYLAAIAHQGNASAENQLSIRFGHIGIPYLSSAYAMDRTFEKLEPLLGW